MNQKPLIWDLPTRVCHWAFAFSLTAGLGLALTIDDDNPWFRLHMLFGLIAGFVLIVRLILGVIGSRSAQFTSFPLSPRSVLAYFRGIVLHRAEAPEFAGHNPGSALAAVAMFALVPVIVLTGIGIGGESFEEAHTVFAYLLLGVIVAHLFGLALHSITHRENISMAMVNGRKIAPAAGSLRSMRPIWGAFVALSIGVWSLALFQGYNSALSTVRLPLIGATLRLGENEGGENRTAHANQPLGGRSHSNDDHD